MLGAGVFAAFAPASEAAGAGLLLGLAIAGSVAACNATSSARLASRYPGSGGTYLYGRERLGAAWGFLAGWAFITGKTASCAAIALTFGSYLAPDLARPLAIAAVVLLAAVNYLGITKTAALTRWLVAAVLASLALVVAAAALGGESSAGRLDDWGGEGGAFGVLRSAGFLFFAFAGYARIATLGEEVREPRRTIPRAIAIALGVTVSVYAVVAVAALAAAGPEVLATADAPLVAVVETAGFDGAAPLVRAGAAVATLSVLLSLLAGVSRTTFAMSSNGDLPRALDAVHPRHRAPHRAELAVAALVLVAVLLFDVRGAIGFSSVAVLTYYAITNASALTLRAERGPWLRLVALLGLVGCATIALTLPRASLVGGLTVIGVGVALWLASAAWRGRRSA